MSSRLTLAEVRTQLYKFVTPSDSADPDFLAALNRVCDRLFSDGSWVGLTPNVAITIDDEHIALPRQYESVLGAQFNNIPVPVQGRYFEYAAGGPGQITAGTGMGQLVDVGETPLEHALLEDSVITAITVGGSRDVRVFGTLSDGTEANTAGVAGIVIAGTAVGVASAATFSTISAVTLPSSAYSLKLKAGSRVLASYVAADRVPLYRRYKIAAPGVTTVRVLCKRRFVPLVNETDFVYPGNLAALKLGLLAESWENQNDFSNSEKYWALSAQALSQQLRSHRGGARSKASFDHGEPLQTSY